MEVLQKYSLKMKFNGEEFSTTADNLEEAVLSLKPKQLHTEVFVTASKGDEVSERRWKLIEAKRIFSDADVRQVFVNNLLLT